MRPPAALKGSVDFTQLEEELHRLSQEVAGALLVHALEEIDQNLLAQKEEGLEVVCRKKRTLVTSVGEITFKRRLYVDKEGNYTFLLDEALGLEPSKRISRRMKQLALELATEMSFRRAAKVLGYIVPTVSHMGVWNVVKEAGEEACLEANKLREDIFEQGKILEGERKVSKLYIEADEVWVRRQRGNGKKGLGMKLVVGYEGKTGQKKRLKNRRSVVGVTDGAGIWEEAGCDFGQKWKLSEVRKIRIGGDGASWIKGGIEHFPGASYHLDPFHLHKRLTEALSNTNAYETAVEGIEQLNCEAVIQALDREVLHLRGARKKRVKDLKKYLLANWSGMAQLPEEERLGTIEGQVRHTIARRMKHIGGRWTLEGADRMGRLLAAKASGELNRYTNATKNSLVGLVGIDSPMERVATCHEKDLGDWLRAKVPALKGPHASKPWIKYVLKELSLAQWSA